MKTVNRIVLSNGIEFNGEFKLIEVLTKPFSPTKRFKIELYQNIIKEKPILFKMYDDEFEYSYNGDLIHGLIKKDKIEFITAQDLTRNRI